ncbi:8-oxoguanine DNA glycosylase [Mitsuaria sp. TWR114]|uniref:8-oxoguanine DNA glycosylase n=1 Tax=Mitsuaria sp. TWR114 TaxID=2601731 RepID=UPI0011BED5F6|nr:8-oxoguanine DNA glycosylase [Mitsuaria sp. TWR114]TXD92826.1 8-oxoguanine DNA glycosylase [Mitsuaria sp. TWR114]
MSQTAAVFSEHVNVQVQLPDKDAEVMPGVAWGGVEEFPSPAYWVYQVLARRVIGTTIKHRLGTTLAEEVAACLLGGHGIPANVGLAAFRTVRDAGLLCGAPAEEDLLELLKRPIDIGGRPVRYRFAAQKARYLSRSLAAIASSKPPQQTGRELRDWLLNLPGIGHKTASWIARNWLDADDVAILDIHILRAGALGGFMDQRLTVERNYLELEQQFLEFSRCVRIRASELDSVIWTEMMTSPRSVSRLLEGNLGGVMTTAAPRRRAKSAQATDKRRTDTRQTSLFK